MIVPLADVDVEAEVDAEPDAEVVLDDEVPGVGEIPFGAALELRGS